MRLQGLDHVALFVQDVHRCAAWYRDVLGLERRHEEAWGDFPIVMVADGSGVALFPAAAEPIARGARAPGAFAHVAFRVDARGMREAKEELRARGVPFAEQDHVIARSIYVADPDGHEVELTTYEV